MYGPSTFTPGMSCSRYLLQRSSGRGGAGNIRPSSTSREYSSARPNGPDDFSVTRGREPRPSVVAGQVCRPSHQLLSCVHRSAFQVVSTGRGGVGNIRSPSRDITIDGPARPLRAENGSKQSEYEDALIRSSDEARTSGPVSSRLFRSASSNTDNMLSSALALVGPWRCRQHHSFSSACSASAAVSIALPFARAAGLAHIESG